MFRPLLSDLRAKHLIPLAFAAPLAFLPSSPLRCQSTSTSSLLREPSPAAPRHVPHPVVFLDTRNWDGDKRGWDAWAAYLLEKGFTCLEVRVAADDGEKRATSEEVLEKLSEELRQQIKLSANPFPPIVFSRNLGTLILETHLSNHPVSAAILLNPPPNPSELHPPALPTPPRPFTYEAFPRLAVVGELSKPRDVEAHRHVKSGEVDAILVGGKDGVEGGEAMRAVERWLDEQGF